MTFSQEEIDHFLRVGSNSEHARMRLVEYLATPKLHAEHVAFVRQMYHGGYGIQTADNMYEADAAASTLSVIPWWLAVFAVAFSVLVGIAAGYYPAEKAVCIPALEAIKHE